MYTSMMVVLSCLASCVPQRHTWCSCHIFSHAFCRYLLRVTSTDSKVRANPQRLVGQLLTSKAAKSSRPLSGRSQSAAQWAVDAG